MGFEVKDKYGLRLLTKELKLVVFGAIFLFLRRVSHFESVARI